MKLVPALSSDSISGIFAAELARLVLSAAVAEVPDRAGPVGVGVGGSLRPGALDPLPVDGVCSRLNPCHAKLRLAAAQATAGLSTAIPM
jgi:hypothetical protein